MSLKISTSIPQSLLGNIKAAIDKKHVVTWRYQHHQGEDYFTHTTPDHQWDAKAWLKPRILQGNLVFNIKRPDKSNVNTEMYAVYHGRFTEMLLAHFRQEFSGISVTAMPDTDDLV